MEPEVSLPSLQVPATCPCPEPDKSSPCPIPLLKIRLNIILPSTLRTQFYIVIDFVTLYQRLLRFLYTAGNRTQFF
jgi:hypothetical protein